MKVKKSKDKITYSYSGSLREELSKAEKELNKLQTDPLLDRLQWAFFKAKREYEAKTSRITQLEDFIRLAKEKLKEENHE